MAFQEVRGALLDLSADVADAPWEIAQFSVSNIAVTWSGITAFDSTLEIQGSLLKSTDDSNWNIIEQSDTIIDDATNLQIWEIIDITCRYIRVSYTANTNTTGTLTILYLGVSK